MVGPVDAALPPAKDGAGRSLLDGIKHPESATLALDHMGDLVDDLLRPELLLHSTVASLGDGRAVEKGDVPVVASEDRERDLATMALVGEGVGAAPGLGRKASARLAISSGGYSTKPSGRNG